MSEPPTKKAKVSENGSKSSEDGLRQKFKESRLKAAESVEKFKFNKNRAKLLTGNEGFLHREAKGLLILKKNDSKLT